MNSTASKIIIVLFSLFTCFASAEPVPKEIDSLISKQMSEQRIPGLSIAVVKNGEIIAAKGYGLADLKDRVQATAQTVYSLGSVTKQFTATAIMLLVEEERIALDASISTYIDRLPEEWSNLTVRNLLTHTSGIKEEHYPGGVVRFDRREHEQRDIIQKSFGPLLFEPDSQFVYSNIGYRLLGMIIETVSGQTYWDFLETHIFAPQEMSSTRNSDPAAIIPYRAIGYGKSLFGHKQREAVTPSSAFSEGALMSSVLDLAKWDIALSNAKIINKPSLDQMWTSAKLSNGSRSGYGFGWYVPKRNGRRMLEHTGGLPGFSCAISKYRDDDITVIVLTNYENTILKPIVNGIADIYLQHKQKNSQQGNGEVREKAGEIK
jgi:CubicO group peptidase (beta-lactamase class C family)